MLKAAFFEHLSTSQHQYGFKQSSSTAHALHCLCETVNFYINNNSRVYCSFLDASKAFDRLVHAGLFLKLIRRNIPLVFLEIIMSWYSNLQCRVKWGNTYSNPFTITAGEEFCHPIFIRFTLTIFYYDLKPLRKGVTITQRLLLLYFMPTIWQSWHPQLRVFNIYC